MENLISYKLRLSSYSVQDDSGFDAMWIDIFNFSSIYKFGGKFHRPLLLFFLLFTDLLI